MFRTRRRRWARTAGVEQRESPWALQVGAVGGQVRPSGAVAASLRPRFLVQRHQEAPRAAPWALFRARRRRWARAAMRGAAREPPWAAQKGEMLLKPPFEATLLVQIAVEMGGYCPWGSAELDIARGGVDQARFHSAPFSLEIPMNIEALCAAPPEALTHSPSQMPLSCLVAPQAARGLLHPRKWRTREPGF